MSGPAEVLVVGASAGGLSTVEALRRAGYAGRVTVLGAEPHLPYDRPPLSKQVLSGAWAPERALLRAESMLSSLHVEFILGDPAIGLEPASRTVRTASGRVLRADAVVVATGLRPRRLPEQEKFSGVHVLRTLDDALALRTDLLAGSRVVVVGDGVLGAEIAATARSMGSTVTLAGPQRAPMDLQFGSLVADKVAELHTRNGVRLRLGSSVTGLEGHAGRVTGVRLATDEVLDADAVVVAFGAAPVTDWLVGSGLKVDNGLVCDSRCKAAEGIYAVGDVARWHHERLGALLRLENRTNATEQAAAVAANILGADRPYTPVPYFWTDQFDAKIQVYGAPAAGGEVSVVEGDIAEHRFVALYRRENKATAVLGWNMPKQTRRYRQEIVEGDES